MIRGFLTIPFWLPFLLIITGCNPARQPIMEADLPPAYPRAEITDLKLLEAARAFSDWALNQKVGDLPIFQRMEALPPVDTLLPYGIGSFQKEHRFPLILITGAGWQKLTSEAQETTAAAAYTEIGRLLGDHPIKPTLTLQTPLGEELGWINALPIRGKLLHGQD